MLERPARPETCNNWENNWSFYKQHVQDFPGNISTNPSLNEAVLGDFNDENRKNLLILDLISSTIFF